MYGLMMVVFSIAVCGPLTPAQVGHFNIPCGVSTTNNGCAESTPPPGLAATLQKATLASPLPTAVSNLLDELARADAIYLKATMSVVNSADGTKATGSYEYWERDGHYRIRIDPSFNFTWTGVAFDGEFLQAQTGVDAVEIRRGDDRLTPLPDGPLTLALAPLRVSDPTECPACQLRLADLKRVQQWRRDAGANLATLEVTSRAGTFDAGGLRSGEADAAGRLVRLIWPPDQTSEHNRLEITLGAYQPIDGTRGALFPMRLTEQLTPERSQAPELSVTYTMETVDLSPHFGDEVFDIRSNAHKILYGYVDKDGNWHGHYVRWIPTPGLKCDTKSPQ